MVEDVEAVQDLLLRCALPAAIAWTVGLSVIAFTAILLPAAGLVLAAGVVAAGAVLPVLAAFAARANARRAAGARTDLAVHGLDVVRGADDLAVFGAKDRFVARANADAARLAKLERRGAAVEALVAALGTAVQGLTAVGVLWVAQRQNTGDVLAIVLTLTALAAMEAVLPVAGAARRLSEILPSTRRVTELLATPSPRPHALPASPGVASVRGRASYGAVPALGRAGLPWARPHGTPVVPASPDVELVRVRVAYGSVVALDGVDLRVPAGRTVAIVGASGAGKSTLLGALSGEVAVRGAVLLGGVPLDAYDAGDVRATVRGTAQDAHVFGATVRANVALARPDAALGELDSAASRAGLLGWIRSLPAGWETPISGDSVSGGQRQRLLLARALLADPAVLVLDEPTEGLDLVTADRLVTGLLTCGRTVVLVTHRLAPLVAADEVIVLDRGKVAERGAHADLIMRAGPYRDLWEAECLQATGLATRPS